MNFLNQTLDSLEDQIVELRRERNALRAENAGLVDDMNLLRDNNTALRAKIEEMEKQEPVAQVGVHKTGGNAGISWSARPLNEFDSLPLLCDGDKLYLAPGAQPALSIPEGWKLVPIEPTQEMKTAAIGVEVYQDSPPSTDCLTWKEAEAIYTAMIAAAPEAKP